MSESPLEAKFVLLAQALGLPPFERGYRFEKPGRSHVDFAWPGVKVCVEIQGGARSHGAHTRGSGYVRDCGKLNRLTLAGWRVFWLAGEMITADALEQIKAFIEEGDKCLELSY